MGLFIVWLLPIVILFWLKWKQLDHGTILDLLKKDVNPICKKCGCCDDELASIDWLVFIPFLGLIGIVWILFHDKLELLYQEIKEWVNKPIK